MHRCTGAGVGSVHERRDPGLRTAQDEGVDIVRAFIGVHDLEVHHVAHHAELVDEPVAAHHVPRQAGDFEAAYALGWLERIVAPDDERLVRFRALIAERASPGEP